MKVVEQGLYPWPLISEPATKSFAGGPLAAAFENSFRQEISQSTSHQRASLIRPQLLANRCVHQKLDQSPIEKRISLFVRGMLPVFAARNVHDDVPDAARLNSPARQCESEWILWQDEALSNFHSLDEVAIDP